MTTNGPVPFIPLPFIPLDIKPANIMLGKYGETLVVDWGLAKVVGRSEEQTLAGEETLKPASDDGIAATQMGRAMGTPQYMSPEQAAGRLDAMGPRSDVYSLGATLYSLLTGRSPFASGELWDVVSRVAAGEFTTPRRVNRHVPRALEAICVKAMALKPADRYASARALADDIEKWLADEPVAAHREPVARRMARCARKNKGTTGAAAAAGAVLVVGGFVASAIGKRVNEQTRALAAADALLSISAAAVPLALDYLRPIGHHAMARLRQHLYNEQADSVQRLHAAYALADLGEAPLEFLLEEVENAPAGECRNLVAALAQVKETVLPEIVRRAEFAKDNAEKARFTSTIRE